MRYKINPRLLDKAKINSLSLADKIYSIETKDSFTIVKRLGVCDYKKCKGTCCKFMHWSPHNDYAKNFGKSGAQGNSGRVLNVKCNNLQRNNSCPLFGKKSFPKACEQFPHITDKTYWQVHKECSFYFEIIEDFDLEDEE